ncbi:S-layer homology domain-containing protein [Paenibacillus sp. CF384]|uniref:S-layer homology domain-containing protein n=1 Tax=Paenibacillus sp. CF384 TaxID=1884382 RepID=UPI000899BE91|nr:S-layer homology domain-containing protein [Paenibacillus sp. CF384]SDW16200.1 Spore germination protein YaaH [Paenibacillus sp. CF384]
MKHHTPILLRAMAASIGLFCLICFTNQVPLSAAASVPRLPYDDLKFNFARESILNMTQLGIMNGTGERRFEPDKGITRAEFITLIDRLLGIKPVASEIPSFKDVSRSAWYYQWVQPALQLGIAQGNANQMFEPVRPVSREEAAVIMNRALNQAESTVIPALYDDQDDISEWALPAVIHLSQLGLITGNEGKLRPKESITRQEAAVLMDRVWKNEDWSKQITAAPLPKIQLGWQYGQSTQQFEQQVVQSTVNTLSPRWFFIGKNGALEDQMDASLLTWTHEHGKKLWAMVGNHSDQAATHTLLSDLTQRQAFIKQLTDRVQRFNIDGLNIDFENMMPQDRDAFTSFVKALKLATKATISVNVSPDFGYDWTEVFDYNALGELADYVLLMGYDEHWGGAPVAGSVSSLPWLRAGIEALLEKVPSNKVILALSLYTRLWKSDMTGGGVLSEDISLIRQNNLVISNHATISWDERLGQYFAAYSEPNNAHVLNRIWLEDGRSLSNKIGLGESYSIAGYGYWYLGGESRDSWTSVRNSLRYHSYSFS